MKKYFIYSIMFFSLFLISDQAQAAVLSKPVTNIGLAGYWQFSEGSGTTARDSSGNGNTGTLTNMEQADHVPGKSGGGVQLDGSNEYVPIPTSANLQLTQDITVSAWVKPSVHGGIVVGKWNNSAKNFYLYLGSPDDVCFDISSGGSNSEICGGAVTVGSWSHIAGVYNFTTQTKKVYLNGVEVASGSETETMPGSADFIDIGRMSHDGGIGYYNGVVDDVRIYNRPLSATEIARLASVSAGNVSRRSATNTGLVGYWSFNEGSGTLAGDYSTRKNPGTLTNAVTWTNGKLGKGVAFDGTTDDYVNLGSSRNLVNGGSTMTISAWVKTSESSPNAQRTIIAERDACSGNENFQFSLGNDLAGEGDRVWAGFWSGGSERAVQGNVVLTPNTWYHVAITYDGSNLRAYVNGAFDNSASATGNIDSDSGTTLQIGDWNVGSSCTATGNFKGSIDEVRIYNRTLSATEIKNLSQSGQFVANSSQNNRLTDGLIGMWSFNGADISGTTAYDRSGQGNNGTITNGSTKVQGMVGQALNFDGTDDYVEITNTASLQPARPTLSAWIKRSGSMGRAVISYEPEGSFDHGYIIQTESGDNKIHCYFKTGGWTNLVSVTTPAENTWYFVTCTYDESTARLYINGVEEANSSVSTPINYNSTGGVNPKIGKYGSGYWSGAIDEMRLYNRPLSASEVKQLYLMGR